MEFGKVPLPQLNTVDFTLPPDPALTTATLRLSERTGPLQVYTGCSSWGQKVWKGNLFPAKIKDSDFLTEYARHFNLVELNTTYYRIWEPAVIRKWHDHVAARPDFKFCPKFYQAISHVRRLQNADDLSTSFFESILAFEDKLGPAFLQLNENFAPGSFNDLQNYLHSLPQDLPVFTELRHPDWFAQPAIREAAFTMMHQRHIGAVITDTAGRRDAVHMHLSIPHVYLRFVGNALHPTDYTRIDAWVQRLKEWSDQGLQSVYLAMHQPDERTAPVLCDYFVQQINKHLGLNIAGPRLLPTSGTLF